ncbi:MAG: sigma-54-dependent Fis family transcriptional regulator [Candidatus Marinimicrobia bacterium]|nr:sigma-54-dependent Fis family transcriptional regulator [Candidatus Neomarinimicrobiota bacterium]
MASVLIVDDDIGIRATLQEVLEAEGHEVTTLMTAEDALSSLKKDEPDLILLDFKLPGMDGLKFLEHIKDRNSNIPVVMITSHANVSSAVTAMKLGAWDYIEKPFNLDRITLTVQKALDNKHKDEQIAYLQKEKNKHLGFNEIIGKSYQIEDIFKFIRQVANSPRTTVLIQGETGTGKELVARAIHYNSVRASKPFIEINCSAFQEPLLEAELFGYEAGAFTGAIHRKKGLLELAHQGTFFLDEIGEMNIGLQSKLLKVIEDQSFRRVGGTKEIKVDTRIISATSRDLENKILENTFRQELYYRLNVASITLPPLRERKGDVLLLAEHFLRQYNAEFKKSIKGLSPDAEIMLSEHSWPGNIRELKNTIERAVLFEESNYLSLKSISLYESSVNRKIYNDKTEFDIPPGGVSLIEIEKSLIEKALDYTNGNQTRAAKLLKISRETLKYRIKKFRIEVPLKKS